MKKAILLTVIAISLCFASCLRDEDRELFRHNYVVQGEIDPNIGVPIAYGKMSIADVMEMLPEDQRANIDTADDGVINFFYSTDFHEVFEANNSAKQQTAKQCRRSAKDGDVAFHWDTTFTYSQAVKLFDEVDNVISADEFSLSQLFVSCQCSLLPHIANGVDLSQIVNQSGLRIMADSIVLRYSDADGHVRQIESVLGGSYSFQDIINGETITILDHTDISTIIADRPTDVFVSLRLNVDMAEEWFAGNPLNAELADIVESLQMSSLEMNAHLDVHFPVNIFIKDFPYTFDFDLNDTIGNLDWDSITADYGTVGIDTVRLVMNLKNAFPFKIALNAILLDENGMEMFSLMGADTVIAEAPVAYSAESNLYVSNGSSPSRLNIGLNTEQIKLLPRARKIRLRTKIASSDNDQRRQVAIQSNDFLDLQLYLQLHPRAIINLPLDF